MNSRFLLLLSLTITFASAGCEPELPALSTDDLESQEGLDRGDEEFDESHGRDPTQEGRPPQSDGRCPTSDGRAPNPGGRPPTTDGHTPAETPLSGPSARENSGNSVPQIGQH